MYKYLIKVKQPVTGDRIILYSGTRNVNKHTTVVYDTTHALHLLNMLDLNLTKEAVKNMYGFPHFIPRIAYDMIWIDYEHIETVHKIDKGMTYIINNESYTIEKTGYDSNSDTKILYVNYCINKKIKDDFVELNSLMNKINDWCNECLEENYKNENKKDNNNTTHLKKIKHNIFNIFNEYKK